MNKEQKKIRETLIALKRISIRFKRQESYILSLDIHDPERHRRWYELQKEKNRRYSYLYSKLYKSSIDALKIPLFL